MKWFLSTLWVSVLFCLMACQSPTTGAPGPVSKNLVTNGDFSQGTADWSTYVQNGGAVTLAVSGGVATLSGLAAGTGAEPYFDVQFKHSVPGFSLVAGKSYTLSYEAWASSPRSVAVTIWENGTDTNHDGGAWGTYSYAVASLTTTPQTFIRTFTMPVDNPSAGLCFACGVSTATVYIGHVTLVEN